MNRMYETFSRLGAVPLGDGQWIMRGASNKDIILNTVEGEYEWAVTSLGHLFQVDRDGRIRHVILADVVRQIENVEGRF